MLNEVDVVADRVGAKLQTGLKKVGWVIKKNEGIDTVVPQKVILLTGGLIDRWSSCCIAILIFVLILLLVLLLIL
jgi:t-SNARE syntaxin family protein